MLLAALAPLEIVVLLAAIPTVDVVGVTAPRAKLAVLILSNSILSVALIEPALVEDATGKFTVVEVSAALPLSLLIVAVTLAAFDENGFKTVNYSEIYAVKIKYLEDKIAALEAVVDKLISK
jgi:hypothetical protein